MSETDVEADEDKRAGIRAQTLADKSYPSKESAHLDGFKKLKQKFNKVTVLVLLEAFSCAADQPRSLSISQVRPNQESGTGGQV